VACKSPITSTPTTCSCNCPPHGAYRWETGPVSQSPGGPRRGGARPGRLHAPSVELGKSFGAALASRLRLHAYLDWRGDGRSGSRPTRARRILVPWARTRREPLRPGGGPSRFLVRASLVSPGTRVDHPGDRTDSCTSPSNWNPGISAGRIHRSPGFGSAPRDSPPRRQPSAATSDRSARCTRCFWSSLTASAAPMSTAGSKISPSKPRSCCSRQSSTGRTPTNWSNPIRTLTAGTVRRCRRNWRFHDRCRRRRFRLQRAGDPAIHAWCATRVVASVRARASALSRGAHVEHDDGPADGEPRVDARPRRDDSRSSLGPGAAFSTSRTYCLRSVMVTDWGRPPAHVPVNPALVHRIVSAPTSPENVAIPAHLQGHRGPLERNRSRKRTDVGDTADGSGPLKRLGSPGAVHTRAALKRQDRDRARRKGPRPTRACRSSCRRHLPGLLAQGWSDPGDGAGVGVGHQRGRRTPPQPHAKLAVTKHSTRATARTVREAASSFSHAPF